MAVEEPQQPGFEDTLALAPEGESAAAQAEREGRRRRRGGRGRREREEGSPNEAAAADDVSAGEAVAVVVESAPVADTAGEGATSAGPRADESAEEGRDDGRRRRRGRGRNREDAGDAAAAEAGAPTLAGEGVSDAAPVVAAVAAAAVVTDAVAAAPEPVVGVANVSNVTEPAVEPVTVPEVEVEVEVVETPAAERSVAAYVLQLDALAEVARGAGLEWVNSDADKVRTVQDAIARQPAPVRVPREPRPVVLIDEGPLILVETRRDLASLPLPFETPDAASAEA
jgi:ribonuclease E